MQTQLETLARTMAPNTTIPYGRELAEAQKAWTLRREQLLPFYTALTTPSLAAELSVVVRLGQTAGVTFDTLQLDWDKLTLQGASPDWDRCDLLEKELAERGYMVQMERVDDLAENSVRFTIQALRKDGTVK